MSGCCGCWASLLKKNNTKQRCVRRATYNEREFSIEFENLIEEEDFYSPTQDVLTEQEREYLSKGNYKDLFIHQQKMGMEQENKLKQEEEEARLQEEASIQAKKEAAINSKKRQAFDKSRLPNMKFFNNAQFAKWLSEEEMDITSPDFNVEDFDAFLEKVKAKHTNTYQIDDGGDDDVIWQQEGSRDTTNMADSLQTVELHAVVRQPESIATGGGESKLISPLTDNKTDLAIS